MEKATDPQLAAKERQERPATVLAAAAQRPVLLATRLAARSVTDAASQGHCCFRLHCSALDNRQ